MTCSSAIIPFNFSIQNHELLNINTVDKLKDNSNLTNTSSSFILHSQSLKSSTNHSFISEQSNGSKLDTLIIEAKDLATTDKEATSASNPLVTTPTNMNNGLSNGYDHRLNLDIDPTTTSSLNTPTTTAASPVTLSSSLSISTSTATMGILSGPNNSDFLLFPRAHRDGSDLNKITENGDGDNAGNITTTSQKDWTSSAVVELSNVQKGPKLSSQTLPQISATISPSAINNHKTINRSAFKTEQIDVDCAIITSNHCNNSKNSLVQNNSCDSKKQSTSASTFSSSHQQQSLRLPDVIFDEMMPIDDDQARQSINKCDVDDEIDDKIEPLGPTLNSFLPSPPSSSQSILGSFNINNDTISNNTSTVMNAQNKDMELQKATERHRLEKLKSICNDLLSKQQNMRKFSTEIRHRIRRLQLQYTHKNLAKQMKIFVAENQRMNSIQCQRLEFDFSNFILDYDANLPSDPHHQSTFIMSPNEGKIKSDYHSIMQPAKPDIKPANCPHNFSDSSTCNKQCNRLQSDLNISNIDVQQQNSQSKISKPNSHARTNRLMKENREKLLTTIDSWRFNLRHLETKFDSDATDSSSGGESCDEYESFEDIVFDNKSMAANSTYSTTVNSQLSHTSSSLSAINSHQSTASRNRTSKRNNLYWKWCNERSQIASQWSWLQAHILDLETKLRQQTDLFRHIRTTKGMVNFGENDVVQRQMPSPLSPMSHNHQKQHQEDIQSSSLETESPSKSTANQIELQSTNSQSEQCMRTMPFISMKRRKLVRAESNLTLVSAKKAVKYSSVQCSCNIFPYYVDACVICNGRYNYMNSIDIELMPYQERVSLLDPHCHPILSMLNDVPLGLHFTNYLKREIFDINKTASTTRSKKKKASVLPNNEERLEKIGKKIPLNPTIASIKSKKQLKLNKNKRRRLSTDSVKRSHQRDRLSSGCSSRADSPVPSPSPSEISVGSVSTPTNTSYPSITPTNRRRRSEQHAFDINNIVIPYSIAATTRVERLQYKEIVTPKWRLIDDYSKVTSESKKSDESKVTDAKNNDEDKEDISDTAFQIRHLKCEQTERQRILSYYGKNQKNQTIRNKGPQRVRFESCSKSESLDQTSQDSLHNNSISKYKLKSSAMFTGDYSDSISVARRRQASLSKNTNRDDISPFEPYDQQEIDPPYEPRRFPLPDVVYEKMVEETNNQQKEMEEQQQSSSRSSAKIDVDYDDSMDGEDDKNSQPTIEDDDDDDEEIDEDELNNDDDDDDEDEDDDEEDDVDDDLNNDDDEEIIVRVPTKVSHGRRGRPSGGSKMIGHHQNNDFLANEDDPEWKPPPKLS